MMISYIAGVFIIAFLLFVIFYFFSKSSSKEVVKGDKDREGFACLIEYLIAIKGMDLNLVKNNNSFEINFSINSDKGDKKTEIISFLEGEFAQTIKNEVESIDNFAIDFSQNGNTISGKCTFVFKDEKYFENTLLEFIK